MFRRKRPTPDVPPLARGARHGGVRVDPEHVFSENAPAFFLAASVAAYVRCLERAPAGEGQSLVSFLCLSRADVAQLVRVLAREEGRLAQVRDELVHHGLAVDELMLEAS